MTEQNQDAVVDADPLADGAWYSLVLAEVTFSDHEGPQMARAQFFSRSDSDNVNAARVHQLTRVGAETVRAGLPADLPMFQVHQVHFLAITPLGYFSEEEFFAQPEGPNSSEATISVAETDPTDTATEATTH